MGFAFGYSDETCKLIWVQELASNQHRETEKIRINLEHIINFTGVKRIPIYHQFPES